MGSIARLVRSMSLVIELHTLSQELPSDIRDSVFELEEALYRHAKSLDSDIKVWRTNETDEQHNKRILK
jgi:hypothetical protein